jgi:hypothetical protein
MSADSDKLVPFHLEQPPSNPDLEFLLQGTNDEAQKKAITEAFYGLGSGDPQSFPVQLLVVLNSFMIAMRNYPARLKRMLATESKVLSEAFAAQRTDIRQVAAVFTEHTQIAEENVTEIKAVLRDQTSLIQQLREKDQAERVRQAEEFRRQIADVEQASRQLTQLKTNLIRWGLGLSFTSGLMVYALIEWFLKAPK